MELMALVHVDGFAVISTYNLMVVNLKALKIQLRYGDAANFYRHYFEVYCVYSRLNKRFYNSLLLKFNELL